MKKTIFMMGVEDNTTLEINRFQENGQTVNAVKLNGSTPINQVMDFEPEIVKNKIPFVIGLHKKLGLKAAPSEHNLFNLIANADTCDVSLGTLERILEKNNFAKVFNHPKKIRATSRYTLPKTLANIKGVRLAKVVKVTPCNTLPIESAIEKTNIDYPLIIRLSGFHNSDNMLLIETKEDLAKATSWYERGLSLDIIEYIDTFNKEYKHFTKKRVAVIDGKYIGHHFILTNTWPAMSRQQGMEENADLRAAEKEFIAHFETEFLTKHKEKLDAIHSRVDLDYYGIDCTEDDNGNLIVFETNACMKLLKTSSGKNNEFEYAQEPIERCKKELIKLIKKS